MACARFRLVEGTLFNNRKRCEAWGGTCNNGALAAPAKRRHDGHCGACNPGHYLELVGSAWSCSAYGGVSPRQTQ